MHLLRRTAEKCPQRIIDTPAVLFCLTPCIYAVYFQKRWRGVHLSCLCTDRMSVVPYSIEFFVYEKLEVQKCTWTYISEQWHPCRCCKQSSTYQNRHGWRWFYAAARLHCKRVGKQCIRTYIVYRACGCFLYAPSICIVYFQKRWFKNIRCICVSPFLEMPMSLFKYS